MNNEAHIQNNDISILDRHIKGITARIMWLVIPATAVGVFTPVGIYFAMKTDIAIQKAEIKLINARLDRLEYKVDK